MTSSVTTTRSLTILGATGSIGTSTLDLIRGARDQWRVKALTANCSARELAALAKEFGAELAVVGDESCLPDLRDALSGTGIAAAGGSQALCDAAGVANRPHIKTHKSPVIAKMQVAAGAKGITCQITGDSAEIGFLLARQHWGKGWATEATTL